VWADTRGVYALVNMGCRPSDMIFVCDGTEGWGLQFNDGSGWRSVLGDAKGGPSTLRGFPGGPVILPNYNQGDNYIPGALTFINGDAVSLQKPPQAVSNYSGIRSLFATGPDHAYLLYSEATGAYATDVYEYASGNWTLSITLPELAWAIWADADNIVVVGSNQSIYRRKGAGSEFTQLSGVPAGNYNSVWAFGPEDIWAGNSGQIVHFDGDSYQIALTNLPGSIAQLWGSEGELYFRTSSVSGTSSGFGRWNGTSMETLIAGDTGVNINDMWGISKNEVFLAVQDSQMPDDPCGGNTLVWYDGATFHEI
jgi:hypothetical protein